MRLWILAVLPCLSCATDAAYCRTMVECNGELYPTVGACQDAYQEAYDWVEQQSGAECRSTYEELVQCMGRTYECSDRSVVFVENPPSCMAELTQQFGLSGCGLPPVGP